MNGKAWRHAFYLEPDSDLQSFNLSTKITTLCLLICRHGITIDTNKLCSLNNGHCCTISYSLGPVPPAVPDGNGPPQLCPGF